MTSDPTPSDTGPAAAAPTRPIRDRILFFLLWLRRPFRIANFTPSGKALAEAMVRGVPRDRDGAVVELGGGTGVFTAALLAAGVKPADLIVVEREKTLYDLLVKRFPQISVVYGDAGDIYAISQAAGPRGVKAVVSGLPILTMSVALQTDIVGGAFRAMDDDGVFIQFTYTRKSPVKPEVIAALDLECTLAEKVPRNAPPARVYHYRRKVADAEAPSNG
ncbi:MAG: ribose ABC transporter permease [Azospirillaceae bacterium]